ncbi:hypothetical protein LRS05_11315 [Flavobacterium sp. J372]|uniref:hypothetical protein n=1 Tax=Flavobacterium sp. J372 TaxID=2898436 RepID=UPI00215110E6|nr:hypothetical protein [Flavobacterium sp. J372]MCR5862697.1 hypothetical protein [Flavobacterium sp. J372]
METQKYIDAVREISTIERPHHSVSRVSNVLLFREYLRRLRLWKFYFGEAGELNIIDKSNHNLLTYLSGEDGYDNTPTYETFITDLRNKGTDFSGPRSFEGIFAYLIVMWELFSNNNLILNNGLPDPYEPLKILLQRTNSIYKLDGQLHIDTITFNDFRKYAEYELPSLDINFLDFVDEQYSFGIEGVPNQYTTNLLLDQFRQRQT